jgi:hypothetical protein
VSQLSLFAADAQPPSPADLEGLLAGPAQLARRGDSARLSVRVDAWRADVLTAQLDIQLGITAETVAGELSESPVVRTPFLTALRPLAERWTRGSVKRTPDGWRLDGRRLWWWCVTAGRGYDGVGYTLALGAGDELVWPGVGAALAAAGLAAVFVGPRADGPAYRITGRRRLGRLRELVGDPPTGTPAHDWP